MDSLESWWCGLLETLSVRVSCEWCGVSECGWVGGCVCVGGGGRAWLCRESSELMFSFSLAAVSGKLPQEARISRSGPMRVLFAC